MLYFPPLSIPTITILICMGHLINIPYSSSHPSNLLSLLPVSNSTHDIVGRGDQIITPSIIPHLSTFSRNVSMYICMYACMYICIMYVYMHACTYVCMYVCMYLCMYLCMYICTYVCMYVCVVWCMYIHMILYVSIFIYDSQESEN